ncbi:CobW family GTP-binding protein [Rhizobium sp. SAFR-030]|uniref:CobW family GTP-binding protein n=1 Tax=Rhizobium sp. SAFR-030 TaxID=3387277 RepID=UPI003F7E5BC5
MALASERIPVSILTGFLGAGKSTLLNRILKDPAAHDTAVIINEFGEVGIDNFLVETSGDTLLELSNGCLCCTVRGELVETLASIIDQIQTGRLKPIRRLVIETTGLADPAPVMQAVMGNPVVAQSYQLDGVVTVVDAVHGLSTIERHPEALRQVAVADRLVVTKKTLASPAAVSALMARLADLNPRAALTDGDAEEAGRVLLLENGLYDQDTKIADVARWLSDERAAEVHPHHHDHHHADDHHHHDHDHHAHQPVGDHAHAQHGHQHHQHDVNRHGADIRSFSILHDRPIEPMAIDMFVDLLRSAHGEKLLRMKAIVQLSDNPERPLVLHGVQSIFHPPERLSRWPEGSDRRTRMVLITQGLSEEFVQDLFAAFTGQPRIDRPDRAALEDNPLAVPGLRM